MNEVILDPVFYERLIFPALLALISWFLKDYFLGLRAAREALVRKELEARLKNFWSPIYYWTGVLAFEEKSPGDESSGWDRYGAKQVGELLAVGAHLLPLEHYITVIRALQTVTCQNTGGPSVESFQRFRSFVYGQIEALNFALYTRDGGFDVKGDSGYLYGFRRSIRVLTDVSLHFSVWACIGLFSYFLYISFELGMRWPVVLLVFVLSVFIGWDVRRRLKAAKALSARTPK